VILTQVVHFISLEQHLYREGKSIIRWYDQRDIWETVKQLRSPGRLFLLALLLVTCFWREANHLPGRAHKIQFTMDRSRRSPHFARTSIATQTLPPQLLRYIPSTRNSPTVNLPRNPCHKRPSKPPVLSPNTSQLLQKKLHLLAQHTLK
jgi:hypothetical protein